MNLNNILKSLIVSLTIAILSACDGHPKAANNDLKVVIIRHGEKPDHGDNLSCQGENRALQLSNLLYQKLKLPDYIYVPSLSADKATAHSRMFQTIIPFAVKYNLVINSQYDEKAYDNVAASVLKKKGTVLMVWSHQSIPKLVGALGVEHPPRWEDADFDSILVITYHHDKATIALDKEGLNPSPVCPY